MRRSFSAVCSIWTNFSEMLGFWRKREREMYDIKRKRDKIEKEIRRKEEEQREVLLQKKRLEFLMRQVNCSY